MPAVVRQPADIRAFGSFLRGGCFNYNVLSFMDGDVTKVNLGAISVLLCAKVRALRFMVQCTSLDLCRVFVQMIMLWRCYHDRRNLVALRHEHKGPAFHP